MTKSADADAKTTILLKSDRLGRVKLPAERREALLDEFEGSGMSGQEFAKWAGVKYQTFACWRQKRQKRNGREGKERPIAMNLVEAVLPEAVSGGGQKGAIMIHLPGGLRMECGSAGEAAEFVRLLGVQVC